MTGYFFKESLLRVSYMNPDYFIMLYWMLVLT